MGGIRSQISVRNHKCCGRNTRTSYSKSKSYLDVLSLKGMIWPEYWRCDNLDGNDSTRSVLIVDDDIGILESMADILIEKHFIVTMASDGFKAIELVKENHYDAIIMDVRMPGIDGVETFKKMKTFISVPKTIFMTAFALEDMIMDAKAEGAIAVLIKPIDLDELDVLLRSAMDSTNLNQLHSLC
jgi:DNA-binding NtrC family response regulator